MELRLYLRIMIANWWIVVAALAITVGAALVLTIGQTPIYRSSATYVVKTNLPEMDARTLISALEVLSDGQIQPTVSALAGSQVVKAQAGTALGLTPGQQSNISVNSKSLSGTNVIEITVEGTDPVLVRDFAAIVGTATADLLHKLYGAYQLEALDTPTVANSPVRPRTAVNLMLGILAGLVLGAGLAFLTAYLRAPIGESLVAVSEKKEPESEGFHSRNRETVIGIDSAPSSVMGSGKAMRASTANYKPRA